MAKKKKKVYKLSHGEVRNAADYLFLNKSDKLTLWESTFVDVVRKMEYPLGDKQLAILTRIWNQHTGGMKMTSAWE